MFLLFVTEIVSVLSILDHNKTYSYEYILSGVFEDSQLSEICHYISGRAIYSLFSHINPGLYMHT